MPEQQRNCRRAPHGDHDAGDDELHQSIIHSVLMGESICASVAPMRALMITEENATAIRP